MVLISLRHEASEPSLVSERGKAGEQYTCHFRGLPADVIFRPPRITDKPIVQGPQTAIVVGPAGKEIHTNTYGCIRVQFHWDRVGKSDEKSSCWVRVAQSLAGNKWGVQVLPRIGQEVVVEFLEGNPDRPLVTGSVYNADTMPPYVLPANKTQSGFKSRSSKQGGRENFNEIRFEDKKGSEEVVIHAEKNMSVSVENDDTKTVGANSTETVTKDKTVRVLEGDYELDVQKGTSKMHFKGAVEETFDATREVTVTGNLTETFEADKEHTVTGMETHNVDAMLLGNYKERITNLFGPDTLTVNGDLMIEVSGGTATIKVGGNSVVVTSGGVEITGTNVTVHGTSVLALTGGVVKINC